MWKRWCFWRFCRFLTLFDRKISGNFPHFRGRGVQEVWKKIHTFHSLFLEVSLTSIIQRVHVLLLVRSCFVTIFLGRGWQQSQAEVELLAAEANSSLVFTELSLASTAILSDALLLILHFCEKKKHKAAVSSSYFKGQLIYNR